MWLHFTIFSLLEADDPDTGCDPEYRFLDASEPLLLELLKDPKESRVKIGFVIGRREDIFLDFFNAVYPEYLAETEFEDDDEDENENEGGEMIEMKDKIEISGGEDKELYEFLNQQPADGFLFDNADDLIKNLGPPEFLVDKYIETDTIVQIFGDKGTYKSFLVISLGCSVATGMDWMGHKVKQGPVIYILGEGRGGFGRRLAAWKKKYGAKDLHLLQISRKPAHMTDEKFAKDVMYAISRLAKKFGQPALIIFDTLNRNFGPGNENSTEDMTSFVCNLDMVRNGCVAIVVHHTGLSNKDRSRGSSALPAATGRRVHRDLNGTAHLQHEVHAHERRRGTVDDEFHPGKDPARDRSGQPENVRLARGGPREQGRKT